MLHISMFHIRSPENKTYLFKKVRAEVEKQGGRLIGDIEHGTIEGNTPLGLVKIRYSLKGDYYEFTKISGSFLISEDMIKQEILKYFQ